MTPNCAFSTAVERERHVEFREALSGYRNGALVCRPDAARLGYSSLLHAFIGLRFPSVVCRPTDGIRTWLQTLKHALSCTFRCWNTGIIENYAYTLVSTYVRLIQWVWAGWGRNDSFCVTVYFLYNWPNRWWSLRKSLFPMYLRWWKQS